MRRETLSVRRALGALLLVTLCLVAAASSRAAESAGVVRATLANGLRVVIVPDPLAPVATTQMNYLVGANETPPGFPGMAHAEEHMMFRGSPGLSADQLTVIAAEMGGRFNAATRQTVTQYFFTVPVEELDVALHIEALRMRGVLNDDVAWKLERGAIEQEIAQDLSNPQYIVYTKLLEAMFRGTPYAHDGLGTKASFDGTTAAMLAQFHDTWYVPNNAILVVAGHVDPPRVLATVHALFDGIPARPLPPRPEVKLGAVTPGTLALETDRSVGMAAIAFRVPGSDSPDYAATRILADVLASERGTLYALVPDGKALEAGFSLRVLPQASLGFAFAAFPRGGDGPALLKEVERIVAGDRTAGLPAELIEAAKRHEVTEGEFRKNSVSGLASAWSEAVAVEGRGSPDDDIDAMKRVTVDDVMRVARQYLDPAHAVTVILRPGESGKPATLARFGGEESLARTPGKPVTLPDWAKAAVERLAVPPATVRPTSMTLANGLRLVVVSESVSDTVGVYGHIKNHPALETPPGQEGVDEVLAGLFGFGTTSLDRLALQRALDDIAADESAGTDFGVQVLRADFDRGVELLADHELHPAWPPDAFSIVRRQTAEAVAGRLQSPGYLTGRALRASVFPKNDPTQREATPATVSALTEGAVRSYFQRVFRPDLTTIVVVGNVTPDTARATIEKYFGGWQATGPRPETDLPAVPPSGAAVTAVPNASRQQDRVTLAQTLAITRSSPEYYALVLGNEVLSGGLSGRLYRDLRESTGLVYYVSSSVDAGKTRALLIVGYGADPANVGRAHALIARDLRELQTTAPSDEELRRAKALLLRRIPLAEASVRSIAEGLLARTGLDLPLDEPTRAARRYLALTGDEVKAAFTRFVRPGGLAQVSEGPTPQ